MKTISTILLGTLFAMSLGCGYSAKQTPPTAGTTPAIAQLNPDNANAGAPAFTMTINGDHFASKAVVNWNGTGQATTFVSSGQLTISVPATAVATAGTVKVTVTNPGTSGGMYGGGTLPETSTAVDFTIN
jgi:hypothetical protein